MYIVSTWRQRFFIVVFKNEKMFPLCFSTFFWYGVYRKCHKPALYFPACISYHHHHVRRKRAGNSYRVFIFDDGHWNSKLFMQSLHPLSNKTCRTVSVPLIAVAHNCRPLGQEIEAVRPIMVHECWYFIMY